MWHSKNSLLGSRSSPINFSTPRIRVGRQWPRPNWKALFWLIALIILVWFLFISNYFKINQIIVYGHISDPLKQDLSNLVGKNILTLYVPKYIANLQTRRPAVKTIRIERGLPDTLRIYIEERQQELIWQTGDKFYLLDNVGTAFGETIPPQPGETEKVTVVDLRGAEVKLGSVIVSPQFINFTKRLLEELPKETGLTIQQIQVQETTFNPEVVATDGFKILMDINLPLKAQLSAVKQVLDSNRDLVKEYIDVRVLGRVFVK